MCGFWLFWFFSVWLFGGLFWFCFFVGIFFCGFLKVSHIRTFFFIFFQNHQGQLEIFDENVAHISTWLYQAEALLDEIEKKSASQKEETVKVGNVVSSVKILPANSWSLNHARFASCLLLAVSLLA